MVYAKIVKEGYRLEATEGRLHILASSTPDLPRLKRKKLCRLPCTVTNAVKKIKKDDVLVANIHITIALPTSDPEIHHSVSVHYLLPRRGGC